MVVGLKLAKINKEYGSLLKDILSMEYPLASKDFVGRMVVLISAK